MQINEVKEEAQRTGISSEKLRDTNGNWVMIPSATGKGTGIFHAGTTTGQEVMDNDRFTEEALKAQDGKKVPFTRELGGPVIGEATLRYDPDAGAISGRHKDQ